MEKNRKKLLIISILGVMMMLLLGCTKAEAKVVKESGAVKEQVNLEDVEVFEENSKTDELSNSDEEGEINLEIFSLLQNETKLAWLKEIISRFNESRCRVNGKIISISLKSVTYDTIISGEKIPDAFTPQNELEAKILKAGGLEINQLSENLLDDLAGIVINKEVYNSLLDNYGVVNLSTIVDGVMKEEIKLGAVNLSSDSIGLNLMVSLLNEFDNEDLLSNTAIRKFRDFQANITEVPKSDYICNALKRDVLDAVVIEYQEFINIPEIKLNDYVFVPFGVKHNNPLYSIGDISEEKQRALKLFSYYATSVHSERLAEECGFEVEQTYISEIPEIDEETVLKVWNLLNEK